MPQLGAGIGYMRTGTPAARIWTFWAGACDGDAEPAVALSGGVSQTGLVDRLPALIVSAIGVLRVSRWAGGARLPAWRGVRVSDHLVRRCWCQARGL